MRIIKKYPNRRLYDTEISRYIILDDVRKLVLDGIDIQVTDAKSEEDLTRSILLQIIAEQEHEGKPIFNTLMLTQIIRFYGNTYQSAFSEYLQKSLEMFAAQQQSLQNNFAQAVSSHPIAETFSKMAEQNMEAWRQLQNNAQAASSHPIAETFSEVAEQNMEAWRQLQNSAQAASSHPIAETFSEVAEQNMEAWRQLQNSFFEAAGFPGSGNKPKDSE